MHCLRGGNGKCGFVKDRRLGALMVLLEERRKEEEAYRLIARRMDDAFPLIWFSGGKKSIGWRWMR